MTNETVLREADTRRELIKMITMGQMRFLGHINRKEKIEYLVMTGKIAGKRDIFMNCIIRRMGGSWTAFEVLLASKDRTSWTDTITNVERQGT